MGWIDPRSAEHQRQRWLRPDWQRWVRHDSHRFLPPGQFEAKSRTAQIEADEVDLSADWEAMRADLQLLSWQVKDLQNYLACRRLGLKYEGQPRDELGQFAEGRQGVDSPKDPGLVTRPAFLAPAVRIAVQKGVEAALALYAAMSARNTPNSTAIFEFNARAFQAQPLGDPEPEATRLTREQVDEICPRQAEVQSLTNQAAASVNRADHASPQAYGTAVHSRVERLVNGAGSLPEDPNFRAEVSASKSGEARRGALGSKRIDVFENPGTGTVCVYDIKTGEKTDLSFARMSELARSANRLYPGTNRIIVTEVRPNK